VLYAKDLLPFLKGGQKPDLRKLLRAPTLRARVDVDR